MKVKYNWINKEDNNEWASIAIEMDSGEVFYPIQMISLNRFTSEDIKKIQQIVTTACNRVKV